MGSLDDTVLRVLIQSSTNSMLSDQPYVISVGVFLSEMHRHLPDQISAFFENPGKFGEVEDKLAPRSVPNEVLSSRNALARRMKVRWEALRKTMIGEDTPFAMTAQSGTAALDVCLSPSLARLFQGASRVAIAAGHQKADIRDLAQALSEDEQLVRELHEDTGLVLKPPQSAT